MFRILFLLFLIIPILEVYLLIEVGSLIGVLPTVALVVLTAIIGVNMLKQQGFATFARLQNKLSVGQMPAMEMMEGVILLISGALLLTPGFFTDVLGFLGLIPFTRQGFANWMIKSGSMTAWVAKRTPAGGRPNPHGDQNAPHQGSTAGGDTIEGEYREVDPVTGTGTEKKLGE